MLRFIHLFTNLYNVSRTSAVSYPGQAVIAAALLMASGHLASSAEKEPAKFIGVESCATAGCHGAADPQRFQFQFWKHADPHSKAFSTLQTARSARMAEELRLGDAAKNLLCTSCHAPFHALPASLKATDLKAAQGVSCESCHGAASNWQLAHTRPDYSHAQRVFSGMRDLQNLYLRANSCVACHQALSSDLIKAGHPELIFELDGQTQAQPRHWQEKPDYHRAQAWLVGQAVALREMSGQLLREQKPGVAVVQRWQALKWMVQQARAVTPSADHLITLPDTTEPATLQAVQRIADQIAKETAEAEWNGTQTEQLLKRLTSVAGDFRGKVSPPLSARKAERLVLALDRISAALPEEQARSLDASLKKLFDAAQILEDFQPELFARQLEQLPASIAQ